MESAKNGIIKLQFVLDERLTESELYKELGMLTDAESELPYEGAKEMLLVDDVENREFLCEQLETMYDELPAPKKR